MSSTTTEPLRRGTTLASCLLAAVGGCVDAVGFLTLGGLFVSHMSGNSAALGAFFGQGDWQRGLPHLAAVPVFVAGLFAGNVWMAGPNSARRCAWLLLAEALLLAAFATALIVHGGTIRSARAYFAVCALPLFAMGIQNAALRRLSSSAFPTTYVTGVLDRFAQALARRFRRGGGAEPSDDALPALGIWLAYATGATAGSAGLGLLGAGVLLVPACVLAAVAGAVRFGGADGGGRDRAGARRAEAD